MYLAVDAQPTLSLWRLDYEQNTIVLNFTAPTLLNPANNELSIDCTAILIGPVAGDISMTIRLLPSTVGLQVNVTTATCDLGATFRYLLEANPSLGINPSNTFLYYDPSGATGGPVGMPGNLLTDSNDMVYENMMGTQADIIVDNNPPAVLSFELLDLNRGIFILSFSQPVNISTLNFTDISFQNSPVNEPARESIVLTNGNCIDGCEIGRRITIASTQTDLDRLKLQENVCVSISTCYLHHTSALTEDFGGNQITMYRFGLNYLLQNLTLDTRHPILEGCNLNLSVDQLTLNFDEPIDVETFKPSSITIDSQEVISNVSIREMRIPLSNASVVTGPSGSTISIHLNTDVDGLKEFMSNSMGVFYTYVQLLPTAFDDIASNNITFAIYLPCSYTSDSNAPNLSSFVLDLNANSLQMTFSEPVHVVDPSSFVLTDAANLTRVNFNDSILKGNFPTRIFSITLGSESLAAIKTDDSIGTETGNTFLLIYNNSITDVFNNSYISAGLIAAANIIADNSPTTAIGFSLDMNIGKVILTFNDVVDVSTLRPNEIFIQNAAYSTGVMHELSGTTKSDNSSIIAIDLTANNLIELKYHKLSGVAANINTTYLTIRAHAIDDITGIDIIAVTDGNGFQAYNYVNDSEPPVLNMFDLDMDRGEITITFNEPVQQRSINFELFVIQANPMVISSTSSVRLSNNGTYDSGYDSQYARVFRYQMSSDVLDLLTSDPQLACSMNSTNLVIMQGGVFDASGNSISLTGPMNVNAYTPHSISKLMALKLYCTICTYVYTQKYKYKYRIYNSRITSLVK